MSEFVWPSDNARATSPELDRVCDYLEGTLDKLDALRAANRDLQDWYESTKAELEKARARVAELERDVAELEYLDSEGREGAEMASEEIARLRSKLAGARHLLFRGWLGCSNHDCIVTGPKSGMGTNGSCKCIQNASRSQLTILAGRLAAFLNDVEQSSKGYGFGSSDHQT